MAEKVANGGGIFSAMTCGLTVWHLRFLADNSWNGGGGYTLGEVGQMTPNQMWTRLCSLKALEKEIGQRTQKLTSEMAGLLKPDRDGMLRGRAADGTPIKGRIAGKSKARQIMEAKQKEQEVKESSKGRKRRRGG